MSCGVKDFKYNVGMKYTLLAIALIAASWAVYFEMHERAEKTKLHDAALHSNLNGSVSNSITIPSNPCVDWDHLEYITVPTPVGELGDYKRLPVITTDYLGTISVGVYNSGGVPCKVDKEAK